MELSKLPDQRARVNGCAEIRNTSRSRMKDSVSRVTGGTPGMTEPCWTKPCRMIPCTSPKSELISSASAALAAKAV